MQFLVPSCIVVVPPHTRELHLIVFLFKHYSFIVTCWMLMVLLVWEPLLFALVCLPVCMSCWWQLAPLIIYDVEQTLYYRNVWKWEQSGCFYEATAVACRCGFWCEKSVLQVPVPRLACIGRLRNSPTCSNSAIKSTGTAGRAFTSYASVRPTTDFCWKRSCIFLSSGCFILFSEHA